MDCRKSLVLALGLAGAVGCVPQNSVQPPPPVPKEVAEKAKDPKNQAQTCVAMGNYLVGSAEGFPPGSAKQEQLFNEARHQYQQALTHDANCYAAYRALAELFNKMSDYDNAVKWYRKGLEKQPKEASLWVALGMCHGSHKAWDAALDAFRRAADLDPENKQYQNLLGSCLVRAGHPDEAFAAFCKGGSKAQAHYHMAYMLHHMKQDDQARRHVQAAVQADPHFEPAQHLLAQLEGREAPAPGAVQTGFVELPAEAGAPQR
jgi:tetratricopeptide (TPR) repeat protein